MSTPSEPQIVEVAPVITAVVSGTVEPADLPSFFDRSFTLLASTVSAQGVAIVGPPFARYQRPPGDTVELEVGFATDRAVEPTGEVRPRELAAGRVARAVHAGGYDELPSAWQQLMAWVQDRDLTAAPEFWEVYLTEPSPDMDPVDLRTELNLRLRS